MKKKKLRALPQRARRHRTCQSESKHETPKRGAQIRDGAKKRREDTTAVTPRALLHDNRHGVQQASEWSASLEPMTIIITTIRGANYFAVARFSF